MFWKKKEKKPLKSTKPSREEILAKAKETAAAARTEIGDETLEAIKAALLKKQSAIMEQAKSKIKTTDMDKVRDHLKYIIREDKGN